MKYLEEAISFTCQANRFDNLGSIGAVEAFEVDQGDGRMRWIDVEESWTVGYGSDVVSRNTASFTELVCENGL